MDFLYMSKGGVQVWALSAMPSPAEEISAGAAIVRNGIIKRRDILLLKRATHETYCRKGFETPNGTFNDLETSIRDALAWEVAEETELAVSRIPNSAKPFMYTTSKQAGRGSSTETIRRLLCS
ncbi:hypothetical protein G7046_g4712 [Stylonectria norvegica]|nr:hypothetical protein G7046_g4712 [Stylonectria norvegica]